MSIDRRGFLVCAASAIGARRVLFAATDKVALRIYGLCALVGDEHRPLTVLMPDAQKLGLSTQHQPRLITAPSNVVESSDPPLTFLDPVKLEQRAYWELGGYKVEMTAASTGGVTNHKGRRARKPADKVPTSDTAGDISWIPDARRFTGSASTGVKPEYLGEDPSHTIVSRIVIPDGELSAVFPTKPIDYSNVTFKVDVPNAPVDQALADGLVTRSLRSGTMTFTLTPLYGSLPPKSITIKAGSPSPTEVVLSNAAVGQPCASSDALNVLHHFSAYYKMLAATPSAAPIPHHSGGATKLFCVSSDEFVRCPPMRY